LRVIYVNHTAEVSGGERSLLALLRALPEHVRPLLAAPLGPLSEAAAAAGVETAPITGTAGSLRLHPLHTPRSMLQLVATGVQVRRLARRTDAVLVHANSIRAGIALAAAALSRPAPGVARIVHVRDCLPRGTVSDATLRLIGASATVVLANSRHTAESVLAVAPRARVEVAYSPVDLARFDPARIDREQVRAQIGAAGERELLLGVVAQLTPWKGQDTAIRALELLRSEGIDAHLLLVGSAKFVARGTRLDNAAYIERLRATIDAAGLADRVSWLGEREDVPELMRALDVLLMPSTEEPFGRAVAEAMAMEVPVLATNVGGPAEIVRDGRDGRLLPPREPAAWARALVELAASPQMRAEMGREGRARVREQFSLERHVETVMDTYARALGRLQSR
jgi:glycosyltransferase involved in cell wall biosynthesis